MNNGRENSNDLLREYISRDAIERAPEGFTSKVMAGVKSELLPVRRKGLLSGRSIVTLISGVLFVLFILALILLPVSNENSFISPVYDLIKSLKFSIPDFGLSSLLNFNFPVTVTYVVTGILILSLLDRALNMMFHREK